MPDFDKLMADTNTLINDIDDDLEDSDGVKEGLEE